MTTTGTDTGAAAMTGAGTREYVVLLYGDERVWAAADDAERAQAYADHGEFSRLCEERGHVITGGAELDLSRTARSVRRTDGDTSVTEGPFAETVEQLGGFYAVRTADPDDLARLVTMLLDPTGVAEIRPVVPHDDLDGSADAGEEGRS